MGEQLPLSTVHSAVLEFLKGRDDVVLFGAMAVNAYVNEPRMTQDIDLQSMHAEALAEELRNHLHQRFHIAVRIREVAEGRGYRLYQVQEPANRHLVDVRAVTALPPSRRIAGVLVLEPAELIASKVVGHQARQGRPKSGTDWRDVAMLVLAFPELKRDPGPVSEALYKMGAGAGAMEFWKRLVAQDIQEEDEQGF